MRLLFEKKLSGTRFRLVVLGATVTTTRQPIKRFKAARHVALSTMFTTQSSTGIVRRTRQVKRWNLRDSVEERNPMLLLGRPLKASAARVGRFVSTGLLGGHNSAAAAASCRGPLSSFPFSFDFDFVTGMCGAAGVSHSPSSQTGTVLMVQKRREVLSLNILLCLPETKDFHGTKALCWSCSARLLSSSAHVSLDKLTHTPSEQFPRDSEAWER